MTCTAVKFSSEQPNNPAEYLTDLINQNLKDLFIIYSEESDIELRKIKSTEISNLFNLIINKNYFFFISDKQNFIMAPFFNDEFTFIHNEKFLINSNEFVEIFECPIENWLDSFDMVKSEVDVILKRLL